MPPRSPSQSVRAALADADLERMAVVGRQLGQCVGPDAPALVVGELLPGSKGAASPMPYT